MGEVENLALARAARDGDCSEVKPIDAMKEFIKQVESGKAPAPEQMLCCMTVVGEDTVQHYTIAAGIHSRAEATGILFSQMNILDGERAEPF